VSREAEILLAIDEFAAALARFRAEVVASMPAPASEPEILAAADDDAADFRPHLMLHPSEAAQRFDLAINTVRFLCRTRGLGRKYGHRWRALDQGVKHWDF
jgi:hypothetical protein